MLTCKQHYVGERFLNAYRSTPTAGEARASESSESFRRFVIPKLPENANLWPELPVLPFYNIPYKILISFIFDFY